ncbi:MAG: phytanoyl-CoA dioxygenase [Chloroflexota bacterium]|nr:phytanoyl-CoA dioxygenase family protein [Caldilinea sp.]GIK71760.1 MAG: phytanoyl-CoA dioxygenase [Chloroflexota bacterium]
MVVTHLTSRGLALDNSPEAFGELLDSSDIADNPIAVKQRMDRDGYVYLPGFLNREDILSARKVVLETMAQNGDIDPSFPVMQAKAIIGRNFDDIPYRTKPELTRENPWVVKIMTEGALPNLFREMLGGDVRYFERIILRARQPAPVSGTHPHCDSVFMNRGTKNLFTTWIPLGDIPYHVGGLMVLEKSHHIEKLRHEYSDLDVDAYCANYPDAEKWASGELRYSGYRSPEDPLVWSGRLSEDPVALRAELGGRWLTASFRAGDVLIFTIYTVHASLDNLSDEVRISIDTRWQLASEEVDERWTGPNPPGHAPELIRGRICH